MAKRNRGNRPGQRHTSSRHQPRPANRPSSALTAAEEARAADLEQQIVARDRTASNGAAAARRDDAARARLRAGTPLAIRAAEEYGYVSRDVKRIVRVGGSMIAILAVVFVLVDVMRVIKIG